MSKPNLFVVTIHDTDHYVRANNKREAQQAAIDDRVSTRRAETDDIIAIARSGKRIIGEPDATADVQGDLPLADADADATQE